jgi:hypothetical protein
MQWVALSAASSVELIKPHAERRVLGGVIRLSGAVYTSRDFKLLAPVVNIGSGTAPFRTEAQNSSCASESAYAPSILIRCVGSSIGFEGAHTD